MKSFILITAFLLCSFSWVSVSVSESQTVEVQPGDEVTLLCSNISASSTTAEWFRVVNRNKASCISSMYGSDGNPKFCDGFKNGKFNMSSNISTVFLKITQVDSSDSGLYLCGIDVFGKTILKEIHLNVHEESDEHTRLMSVILGGLAVFLLMVIIGLVVKIMKFQTGWVSVSVSESNGHAQFCTGFKNGKFKMSSNISTVFLKITQVEISDSGLYLWGFYSDGNTTLKGIHLNVQEKFYEQTQLTIVILSGLTLFLQMVIIGMVVKIMKLQTASNEEQTTPHRELCQMSDCRDFHLQNLDSDNLNYAALSFKPKPKRNRRPVSVEPNVIYAATK
ncbi:uncharacterized protein LOC134005585 [Scomber scombrus]|uniref:uncharacterized protein LOC134005585 n=1 Tax=Scomber scombrus TaxID=13677 RepID=UPI002DD9937A|nr:uncharacterized protein LOC134005585 [Scomber scombrus]